VGTAAEMMLMPYGALIVGFICGTFSTLGFMYLTVRAPGAAGTGVSVILTQGGSRGRGAEAWRLPSPPRPLSLVSLRACPRSSNSLSLSSATSAPLSHSWSPDCASRTRVASTTCMVSRAS
jgi:hypothetical protein